MNRRDARKRVPCCAHGKKLPLVTHLHGVFDARVYSCSSCFNRVRVSKGGQEACSGRGGYPIKRMMIAWLFSSTTSGDKEPWREPLPKACSGWVVIEPERERERP